MGIRLSITITVTVSVTISITMSMSTSMTIITNYKTANAVTSANPGLRLL